MRDSKFLLRAGFEEVVAVDADPASAHYVVPGITFVGSAIQHCTLQPNSFDFGVSCNTLFFLGREDIHAVIAIAYKALRLGGIFACNMLGEKDDWVRARDPEVTAMSLDDLSRIYATYSPRELRPIEYTRTNDVGHTKHWHTWNLVLQKK